MSVNITPVLLTLPIELIYRILDHLDEFTILCSAYNICKRLNIIMDTYHRYKVNLDLIIY